jgi:hypothetical protein
MYVVNVWMAALVFARLPEIAEPAGLGMLLAAFPISVREAGTALVGSKSGRRAIAAFVRALMLIVWNLLAREESHRVFRRIGDI